MSDGPEIGEWPSDTLPSRWCWVEFQQYWLDYTDSRKKVPQRLYRPAGTLAVIDQGEAPIGGYTDDTRMRSSAPLPAIVFGDHTRAIKYVERPFAQGADGVRVLVPRDGINRAFAYQAMRCVRLPDKGYSRHFKFLKSTRFPLAPLPEQHRIVAKIESLAGKSKRAREQLDHVPQLVGKYKQAVLVAAFRGALTREWRKERGYSSDEFQVSCDVRELDGAHLPASWKLATIEKVAENLDGKRVPVKAADRAKRRGKYSYYGASGIIDTINDFLFDGEYVLIGEDGANLLSRSTPIAFTAKGKFWVNNHAHVLKARKETSNDWICQFINMIDLQPFVTGSAQPKLTQNALNRLQLPLASSDEQIEIIKRVAQAFAWIDRITSEVANARKLIDRLDQGILGKAFRGELVSQDPADQSASVLLERIEAERANGAGKVRKLKRRATSRVRLARAGKAK